jgi:hypothetical protein
VPETSFEQAWCSIPGGLPAALGERAGLRTRVDRTKTTLEQRFERAIVRRCENRLK